MTDGVGTGSVLLKGRYELLELVGVGGEARVWKALDRQHDRIVALKTMPAGTEEGRAELLSEARVLLGLAPHPSLPLVRDDFFEGDEYVIVLDWVDGTDLAKLLRASGTPGLTVSSVLMYLADAAEALTVLHTHEPPVIHGDVKPANLILTRGGRVKLVDFGLSSTPGIGGKRRGTDGYRAPELLVGASPSRASDVFALAATAYSLLTGAPSTGLDAGWEGLEAGQGASLATAIRAGLAADPADRPATPGELVERLRSGWASTLPTGVLTFVMSDIEGSTALWDTAARGDGRGSRPPRRADRRRRRGARRLPPRIDGRGRLDGLGVRIGIGGSESGDRCGALPRRGDLARRRLAQGQVRAAYGRGQDARRHPLRPRRGIFRVDLESHRSSPRGSVRRRGPALGDERDARERRPSAGVCAHRSGPPPPEGNRATRDDQGACGPRSDDDAGSRRMPIPRAARLSKRAIVVSSSVASSW